MAARKGAQAMNGAGQRDDATSPARLAGIYLVFVLLVLLYTWPLVLHPASHLREWLDVHYFVWEMGWVARRIVEAPWALFDAPIFYPHGLTLAFSEPMLVPALVTFGPVYWVSGNPILAYNVTVVSFQALAGWAAYYAARRLTGSALAGWIGGIVFALSPIRTGYYHFAHMQLSFAMPLGLFWFARFLERRRPRDLVWSLVFVWCQLVTVIYFGVPLVLMLGLLTVGVLLLRPRGWRPGTALVGLAGVAALAVAYFPVAWPYLVAQREMGFERSLAEAGVRAADLLTYLDAGRENRVLRIVRSGTHPAMFPGFTVCALVAAAFALGPRRARPPLPRLGAWARRLVGWGLVLTLLAIALFLVTGGGEVRPFGFRLRMYELGRPVALLFGLGAAWLALEGWAGARAGDDPRLDPREWAALLGFLTVVFVLLSLGPVMHLGGEAVGVGLYAWLYDVFPPLRALRVTHRLGFSAMLLVGLLAAFGLAALERRLGHARIRRALAIVPLILLVEYLPVPLRYDVIRWDQPPPVYPWLAGQPGDFAVAEWPSGPELPDATLGMWSLLHGKRLVNGSSGFDPPFTGEVRAALARLPDSRSLGELRTIYPLRYLLVHLDRLPDPEQRTAWERLVEAPPPDLRVAGRFGGSVALALTSDAETSRRWARTFSTDLVARHPRARVEVALAREDPEIRPRVDVALNGRHRLELAPSAAPVDLDVPLPPPYPRVDRNVLTLELTYRVEPRVTADARYLIGGTGVHSPADLVVTSAGKEHGWMASIEVNGTEVARNFRGYNVAVVDPRSGRVDRRDVFDTFADPSESARLAAFVDGVPAGWIVAAAIRDDGVAQLGDDAVRAFRTLGARLDPRGALFVSHLLIGVKGAAPGTAIEAVGPVKLRRVVGRDRGPLLVTRNFRLE
jgi:hypothetical protein